MTKGQIIWQQFDPNNEETWPPYHEHIVVTYIDNDGKAHFESTAHFGLGDVFLIVEKSRKIRGGMVASKQRTLKYDDVLDICWAKVNAPEHWRKKEKKE